MGILNNVDTSVSIVEKDIHFVSLNLKQSFNKHHQFKIVINFEDLFLGKAWMNSPTKLIKLIGEQVMIKMRHKVSGETNDFSGVITSVSAEGRHGQNNNYVITGSSSTIHLEGKKTMNSVMDSDLSGVVGDIVANSGNGAKIITSPAFTEKIDYICQYNETAFEVINRLSWIYGEWFYNDGIDTYFGKPKGQKEFNLFYDIELTHFNLTANLVPASFTYYDYLVHDAKESFSSAPPTVPGVRGYIKLAQDKSEEFYTSNSYMPSNPTVNSSKALNQLAEVEKSRSIAKMLVFSGESTTCKVRIGSVANIKLPRTMTADPDVESFLITEVEHIVNEKGYYNNIFKGIPSGIACIPMEEVSQPLTSSQIATVQSNSDGKGRVKVQFQWQKALGKTTNWLRVQTPDGGSSGEVASNRGFVFIPEEDDEVVVGFINGDPSRPFVTGAIFPETKSAGGGDGNKKKSLTTRSGVALSLDDANGSATLTDPSGNSVSLDGSGNMNFNAPASFKVVCGDNSFEIKNDGTVSLSSIKDAIFDAVNNIKLNIGENCVHISNDGSIGINSDTIVNIISKGQSNMESADGIVIKKGEADSITIGDTIDVKSSSDVIIKGTTVQIN